MPAYPQYLANDGGVLSHLPKSAGGVIFQKVQVVSSSKKVQMHLESGTSQRIKISPLPVESVAHFDCFIKKMKIRATPLKEQIIIYFREM
jgi:hypothetical protein